MANEPRTSHRVQITHTGRLKLACEVVFLYFIAFHFLAQVVAFIYTVIVDRLHALQKCVSIPHGIHVAEFCVYTKFFLQGSLDPCTLLHGLTALVFGLHFIIVRVPTSYSLLKLGGDGAECNP